MAATDQGSQGRTVSSDGPALQPPWPAWDSEELYWDKADRIRAFRALQSWYRETHLEAPPGLHPYKPDQLSGSMLLSPDAVANKNFLPGVAPYARRRAQFLGLIRATPVYPRLDHNMLGSMPVCFNLLAPLRETPTATPKILDEVLGFSVGQVLVIEVEVPPRPKDHYLNDNTAFDALVIYEREGKRGFVGIETKYTEPFSPAPSHSPRDRKAMEKLQMNPPYREFTSERYGWMPDAFDALAFSTTTHQMWRNVILAFALKQEGVTPETIPGLPAYGPFDEASVLVISARADRTATTACRLVTEACRAGEVFIKHVTFNDIIDQAIQIAELEEWATEFNRRYLDLRPVLESRRFQDLSLHPSLIGEP